MKLPLLVCLMVVAVSCDEKVKDAIPPGPPGIFTNSTTAAPTTLAPTTNQPTTTPNTTVPTTTKQPTTTTTKPSTTTPTKPPTTTPTKPSTTTPTKPPTTTLPPPTTPAPPPTPVPEPSEGKWALNYPGTNLSCILLDVAVQFEIIDGNSTMKYNVPNDSLASGECGKKNDSQGMTLTWTDPATKNSQILSFGFALNQSKYDLDAIHLSLNFSKTGNDSKTYFLHHDKQEFSTPLHNSYKCAKVQTLNMTDDKNNTKGYLHISHVQLEAFANATGRTFSSAKDCAGSITPDVVPIVVGCVLAALVVMVLVAYLIGRRRCQARGYLSM